MDESTFTLRLSVIVPPSSGFLVYFAQSPSLVLDKYYGLPDVPGGPDWLIHRYAPAPIFWMPRPMAVDAVRAFSKSVYNYDIRTQLLAWCNGLEVRHLMISTFNLCSSTKARFLCRYADPADQPASLVTFLSSNILKQLLFVRLY